MKPKDLTIEALENAIDLPAEKWHGKCSELAWAAIGVLGHGDYAYGHYGGHVDPNGYWGSRPIFAMRHGWVLLESGRILDPTRWSFENVEPYIYIGSAKDYDEGGNAVRSMIRRPCPSADKGEPVNLKETLASKLLFEKVTGTPFEKITREQACWVANLSYDELDFAVGAIYETLIANGMQVFIPIDNYNRAKREGRVK